MAEGKSGGPGGNRACIRWFGEPGRCSGGRGSRRSRGKGCTEGGMVREWKEHMEDQGLGKRVSRVNE